MRPTQTSITSAIASLEFFSVSSSPDSSSDTFGRSALSTDCETHCERRFDNLRRLLEIPRPDVSIEKTKTEAHALIGEIAKSFDQARRYVELTEFEFEDSRQGDRTSLGNLKTTLSRAEEVFVSASSLASEQAWDEWQQLPPSAQIAESELRNAAAKRIEDATTSGTGKDMDSANLSIALTRWNETVVRPAPDIRTARVSKIVAEVQHLD